MRIDLPTLYVVAAFITLVAGTLLLFSWFQNRSIHSLALWGSGYILGTAGGALLALRPYIASVWPIEAGNAAVLLAYGLMWAGARHFERRPVDTWGIVGGAAVWLIACQIDSFYASMAAQIMLSSALIAVYAAVTALEFWRAHDKTLMSRWPAIVLLLVQAGFFAARTVFADRLPYPGGTLGEDAHWIPVGMFALLLNNFCLPFLVVNMTKERLEREHRRAALVDPLTGAANRRAFLKRSERQLQRAVAEGHPTALLILDLDLFKRVNDTFGHQAGDRVLCAFCEVAQSMLRPTDLFGRMGGEEFACLLPGASATDAFQIAERIRAKFEGRKVQVGGATSSSTVSIGIATTDDVGGDLTALLGAADRALYLAKARGRNRVEHARPPLSPVAPLVPTMPKTSDTPATPLHAVA